MDFWDDGPGGVKHYFSCDTCKTVRLYGCTTVRTEKEEINHPLLTCEMCPEKDLHRPHSFVRYF